jgi:DNA-binding HxlR family transcriptional regulator
MKKINLNCPPVTITLAVLGGKWKPLILYHLDKGPVRFNELTRRMAGITEKMLTQQLREMERDGLITRKVYPEVPPRVEYSLSAYGRTLQPILNAMCEWGDRHRSRVVIK